MDRNEQKKVFFRIMFASIKNVTGFGLATALIAYLSTHTTIDRVLMVFAAVVVFLMFISLITLLLFIFYTFKAMPATLNSKPESTSFLDIYAYTLLALAIRLVEAGICIAYIVYLTRFFSL